MDPLSKPMKKQFKITKNLKSLARKAKDKNTIDSETVRFILRN